MKKVNLCSNAHAIYLQHVAPIFVLYKYKGVFII